MSGTKFCMSAQSTTSRAAGLVLGGLGKSTADLSEGKKQASICLDRFDHSAQHHSVRVLNVLNLSICTLFLSGVQQLLDDPMQFAQQAQTEARAQRKAHSIGGKNVCEKA